MFNVDYKFISKGMKIYIIFLIVGVLMLGLGIYLIINGNNKVKSYEGVTEATEIDKNCDKKTSINISEEGGSINSSNLCHPIYYFEVDNNKYTCVTSTGLDAHLINGSKNKVYYDKNDPTKCLTEEDISSSKMLYILIAIGLIMVAAGGINLFLLLNRINTIKKLKTTGTLFKNVPYIMGGSNLEINGRKVQRPLVTLTLPNSHAVSLKGDARFDFSHGDDNYVDVLIDLNNPTKNFFIDFEIEKIGDGPNAVYYINQPEGTQNPKDLSEAPLVIPNQMLTNDLASEKDINAAMGVVAAPIAAITASTPPPEVKTLESVKPTLPPVPSPPGYVPTEPPKPQETISPEMAEPAILIPGVNTPEILETTETEAPVPENNIAAEPAVFIPGVNAPVTAPTTQVIENVAVVAPAQTAVQPAPAVELAVTEPTIQPTVQVAAAPVTQSVTNQTVATPNGVTSQVEGVSQAVPVTPATPQPAVQLPALATEAPVAAPPVAPSQPVVAEQIAASVPVETPAPEQPVATPITIPEPTGPVVIPVEPVLAPEDPVVGGLGPTTPHGHE